jgi:hypothetical protein
MPKPDMLKEMLNKGSLSMIETFNNRKKGRVLAGAMTALCLAVLGGIQEAPARSTPLGNAALGNSTSAGGADGVPSPSGPGIHPGYRLVSFRNAINTNWRFGGFDWLSDGRMVSVLWGFDCSNFNNQSACSAEIDAQQYYGDIQLPPDGRGPGSMHVIGGTAGEGIASTDIQEIYTGLWEPLGILVGKSGNPATDTIYVMTKTGLLRFIGLGPYTNGVNPIKVINTCHARRCVRDSIGPGLYKSFTTHAPNSYTGTGDSSGTGRRWHHFNYGLVRGNDGYLYGGTNVQYDGGNDRYEQGRDRCAVLKMDPVAGTVEVTAGGLRSPNGWGKGPEGEIFFSDVQGNYNPANSINNYRPGRYYGFRCDSIQPYGHRRGIQESFPVVDLNQAGTANTDIGSNPGEITYLTNGVYAGQLLYGDVSFGGIQRVFVEKINNEWQGAVFLFSGGFHSGIGRLKVGPGGALYAGGQAGGPAPASGNWCWGGAGGVGALLADRGGNVNQCNTHQYDFFKLVPKDTVVFELLAVRARVNGFELQFTKKVGPTAAVPSNYTVNTWVNNLSSQSYGGGSQQNSAALSVSSVRIHPDSTRVFLQLASMPAASVRPAVPAATAPTGNAPANGGNVRVVMIKGTGVLAADGSAPWGEPLSAGAAPSRLAAWYTLNFHSTDTAFTPVALVDSRLASPELRYRDFRVKSAKGMLKLETNFAQAARITLRDLRGRPYATLNAAAGRNQLQLPVAHLARGAYVVEVRVSGQTFARPVALF